MSLYPLARRFLFGLEPERAHALTLAALDRLEAGGLRRLFVNPVAALPTKALGLAFPNPVGLAAGLVFAIVRGIAGPGWLAAVQAGPPRAAGQGGLIRRCAWG